MSLYWNDDYKAVEFEDLAGKTIVGIRTSDDKDEMRIRTTDGDEYVMVHEQDCCEGVYLEDICGDLDDLIDSRLLEASESVSDKNPDGYIKRDYQESFTWTFYRLGTIRGSVTIRWYGESNGYYSESVSLYKTRWLETTEPTVEEVIPQKLSAGEWND